MTNKSTPTASTPPAAWRRALPIIISVARTALWAFIVAAWFTSRH